MSETNDEDKDAKDTKDADGAIPEKPQAKHTPKTYDPPHIIFGVTVSAASALGIAGWFFKFPDIAQVIECVLMMVAIVAMSDIVCVDISAWWHEKMTIWGYVVTGTAFSASAIAAVLSCVWMIDGPAHQFICEFGFEGAVTLLGFILAIAIASVDTELCMRDCGDTMLAIAKAHGYNHYHVTFNHFLATMFARPDYHVEPEEQQK